MTPDMLILFGAIVGSMVYLGRAAGQKILVSPAEEIYAKGGFQPKGNYRGDAPLPGNNWADLMDHQASKFSNLNSRWSKQVDQISEGPSGFYASDYKRAQFQVYTKDRVV